MPLWDYAGNGFYYITLVTQHRKCNLGRVENKAIILSDFGKIVNNEWLKSFEIRNELFLDEYIIMPNHLHAIIIINQNIHSLYDLYDFDDLPGEHGAAGKHGETHDRASQQSSNNHSLNQKSSFLQSSNNHSLNQKLHGDNGTNGETHDRASQQSSNNHSLNQKSSFLQSSNNHSLNQKLHGDNGTNGETHDRASQQSSNNHSLNQKSSFLQSSNNHSLNQKSSSQQSRINPNDNSGQPTILIRKSKSVSSFVAGFKSAVNSKIDDFIDEHNLKIPKYNKNNHFFQQDYYDHIIRNSNEHKRIKKYIINNPSKWHYDSFNSPLMK